MSNLDEQGLALINSNMPPAIQPIDTFYSPLMVSGLSQIGVGTTGLNTGSVMQPYNLKKVEEALAKMDFGNYIEIYYDCEDRAFWGLAHLRHSFPGIPAGVVNGTAMEGPVKDKRHAVLIIWYRQGGELNHVYWDPLPEYQGEVEFDPQSFISFPIGKQEQPMPKPIPSNYHYIKDEIINFDENRMVYELRRGDKKGLLDYLESDFDKGCKESHEILLNQDEFQNLWRDYDRALWAFAHIRRAYAGCCVGIAIGTPLTAGNSYSTVILWDKNSMVHYWDPRTKKIVNFKPEKVFV